MDELDLIRVEAQITAWQVEGLRRVQLRMATEQKGELFYGCDTELGAARGLPVGHMAPLSGSKRA